MPARRQPKFPRMFRRVPYAVWRGHGGWHWLIDGRRLPTPPAADAGREPTESAARAVAKAAILQAIGETSCPTI